MNRREFMVTASGVAGGAAVASATVPSSVAAQEDEGDTEGADGENGADANGGDENGDGGGATETVSVVDNEFQPDSLTIEPGTTVRWVWEGNAEHNINPTEQPDEANWEGHPEWQSSGEYEHTFEVEGEYHYICDPHVGLGMEGDIVVTQDAGAVAAQPAEVDAHDLGVPIQAHYVGIATILAIFVSLVFTFYLLKYGESAHTSSPGR